MDFKKIIEPLNSFNFFLATNTPFCKVQVSYMGRGPLVRDLNSEFLCALEFNSIVFVYNISIT